MKCLLIFGVILTIFSCCHGYSFFIPASTRHPGVCIYNGIFLKKGDNSLPSSCQNMHCNDDGSITVQGCGNFEINDCRVIDPINLHKPYPECCKMNFLCANKADGTQGTVNKQVSPLEQGIYA